jgi:hypothetical protein
MTIHAALNALVGLTLMLAAVATYLLLARRYRMLWHPLVIVLAVGTVGMVVSVLGELLFRGSSGVGSMLQRSASGSFAWGVVIGLVVWIGRRIVLRRPGRGSGIRPTDGRAR